MTTSITILDQRDLTQAVPHLSACSLSECHAPTAFRRSSPICTPDAPPIEPAPAPAPVKPSIPERAPNPPDQEDPPFKRPETYPAKPCPATPDPDKPVRFCRVTAS